LFLDAKDIHMPAEMRSFGMVFQDFAIWPHMTVAENVGFPAGNLRGMKSSDVPKRR